MGGVLSRDREVVSRPDHSREERLFVMFYTYVLWSKSIDKYYIGYTQDIERRIAKHNTGGSRWTKKGIPWCIVCVRLFETKREAIQEELRLKRSKNRKALEKYIAG